jgi:hypothetical protein
MECAEGANGTREPFKAKNIWKSAPDSVYRRNAVAVARILGGIVTTSSIKGVTLIASPTAKSSGVVMAVDGPLQLTKWTRINMLVSLQ